MSTSGKKHDEKEPFVEVWVWFNRGLFFLTDSSLRCRFLDLEILEKLRIREQGKLRLERELGGGFKHFFFYPYLGK